MTPAITLLGPQRRPTLDRVLGSLDVPGPIATVTAGWQEREADDAELDALTGGRSAMMPVANRRDGRSATWPWTIALAHSR